MQGGGLTPIEGTALASLLRVPLPGNDTSFTSRYAPTRSGPDSSHTCPSVGSLYGTIDARTASRGEAFLIVTGTRG